MGNSRVPQAERTASMRLRLLEATVDSLVEYGWAGTSTTVVSQRAGVSRGAQLHHFPTKQLLVLAAVDHLTQLRLAELATFGDDALAGPDRIRSALQALAAHYTSPGFYAALELWVAARTDPQLQRAVVPLERRIGRETHAYALALLGIDESLGRNRTLVQATLDLLRGLGLAASLSDDTARREVVIDAWAITLEHELQYA